MTSDVTLRLLLTGVDRSASKALQGVGREAGTTGGKMGKFGKLGKAAALGIAGALVTAGAAAVDFAGDSLAAFADADKSQKMLEDAYKRFPALADVNIDALRKYNEAIQRKTGADADDIAAAQSHLAAFKLTGKQIQATTPLLVDYATKTGKDMPTAAKTLGKALLGNTKALKDMGISYKSTGDPAKDYANIMQLVKEKVGGYAESVPEAEKKSKILSASFGDLQESIGEKLQPAMINMVDAGQGVLDWLDQNPAVLEGATAAWGLLVDGLKGIWFVISKYVAPAIAWYLKLQVGFINGTADMIDAMNQVPGLGDLIPDDAADKLRDVGDGIWSIANGLQELGKEPKIDTGAEVAKAEVKDLNTEIKGLKGKQVKAEAKGDTKEVERLQKKIDKLRNKRLEINAHVKKTGVTTIKPIAVGGGLRISAYRSGGRPKPGQIAQFHKDEFWVPDAHGTVISQARSRALMGNGPAPVVGAAGGSGGLVVNNYVTVQGAIDKHGTAKTVVSALNDLSLATGGRGFSIREGVKR